MLVKDFDIPFIAFSRRLYPKRLTITTECYFRQSRVKGTVTTKPSLPCMVHAISKHTQ